MVKILDLYINALLADATYALEDVLNGTRGGPLKLQLDKRMTQTLAKYISDNFSVVTHIDSSEYFDSGFDATVWRDNNGKTYVSLRGTEGLQDFITDIDLTVSGTATNQIVDMVNWWLKNTTAIGEQAKQISRIGSVFSAASPVAGTGVLSDVTNVSVNGHSLGGHLATAFTRLFGSRWPVDHTYTYNSAGFTLTSDYIFNLIENAIGDNLGRARPKRQLHSDQASDRTGSAGWGRARMSILRHGRLRRICLFTAIKHRKSSLLERCAL